MKEIVVKKCGLFPFKKTIRINENFAKYVEVIWKLNAELKQKGLMPTPQYYKSRIPTTFFDVVPFRNLNIIYNKSFFYDWVINRKKDILNIIWQISYKNEHAIFKNRYFDGKKHYVTINISDNLVYHSREDSIYIGFYSGDKLILNNAHGDYEYANPTQAKINIPDSIHTPQGALKDEKNAQLIYDSILNFIYDNGFELMYKSSGNKGSSYDVLMTIPFYN